jgi:subtilisin family serine protease
VTFGAYRVFGCAGSTDSDIMLAAMERALADDMDILNMSIGSSFNTWPQYPTAAASDYLVKKGMVVVASIGNSGASGVYSAGAPGVGNDVIGTASFDNTFLNLSSATVTPLGLTVGYIGGSGSPPTPLTGSGLLAAPTASPPAPAIQGCDAANYVGFTPGNIAIVQRGTCTFAAKAIVAQNAGASALVIFNNTGGLLTPAVPGATIPVAFISQADGLAITAALPGQTWNWTSNVVSIPNATGGTISSFSSFGLGAELALKPDIGAPGGFIRSTLPIELGSYGNNSGTSMASPHVAGAAALFLEAHPGTSPSDVRDALQNSADPKNRGGFAYLDNTHRQGAGMLDIDDAITAQTRLSPGKISLGEGSGGTAKIQLRNWSGSPVTYDLTHEPAAGTTNTFPTGAPPSVAYSTDYASASFSSSSVTVPGNGAANVFVTITPNALMPDKGVYGGYIKFTPQGGGQEYRVPYAGFKGDYQSIQVLNLGAALFKLTGCGSLAWLPNDVNCYAGAAGGPAAVNQVYTFAPLNALNVPQFLIHFDHQSRSLTGDVYRVSGNKWMGTGLVDNYLPRNSTPTGGFLYAWDGNAKKGQGNSNGNAGPVADGTYYMKFTLTKALGSKKDVETWTSPNFVIDRP